MGNFQGGGNRGGGYRGGNGGGGGGRSNYRGDRAEVTMHKATCDECHKECQVPFRPSGDKPVYCNDCFSSKRASDDRGPRKDFGGDRSPRRDFNARPAQPSFMKPAVPASDMTKQFGDINARLDRIQAAIEKFSQGKAESKPTVRVAPVIAKVDMPTYTGVKKAVSVKSPIKKITIKKVLAGKKK